MPDGSVAECYAKTVAERVAQASYPHGFEHDYWRPEQLEKPLEVAKPSKIFLDSMSDLMGAWVNEAHVREVLDVCSRAHWHDFQLLTKNPGRLRKFEFPQNVWVGVSAPPSFMKGKPLTFVQQQRYVLNALESLREVNVPVKWMSIEPLSFDIAPLLENSGLQWAVIGAATNGAKTYQPKPEWVERLLETLDRQSVKVFFKGNLDWDQDAWREEFPSAQQLSLAF